MWTVPQIAQWISNITQEAVQLVSEDEINVNILWMEYNGMNRIF